MAAISPYQTAAALRRPAPDWTIMEQDTFRVQAYDTYDDVWNNVPEAFSALLRVDDGGEIGRRYVAGARSIIQATHRYLGLDLAWVPSDPPGATVGDDIRGQVKDVLDSLLRREEFNAKFSALKRWMLIRGDALFHVTADPLKPEGTRLRITELHPRTYFPIHDPIDQERVVGCYIVTIITEGPTATPVAAQRLEYHRVLTPEDQAAAPPGAGIGSVWYRLGFFELDGWDDRAPLSAEDLVPVDPPASIPRTDAVSILMQGATLPPTINAIPVYHFRNNRRGVEPFGTSEIQGIETILAGLTQTATDEDLAIGLAGVGVYTTDDDEPAVGEEPIVAPAAIVYTAEGRKFNRVDGVSTVQPLQDHFSLLRASAQETTGVSDVAVGKVDVQTAQSGIALEIQMRPTTAKNLDKEMELRGKLDQLMYDLINGWLPAYEGLNAGGLVVTSSFGSPLPVNRKEVLEEILSMLTGQIISADFAREMISQKLGYVFPLDMLAAIVGEQEAMLDPVAARMNVPVE